MPTDHDPTDTGVTTPANQYTPTERTTVRRSPKRACYDRDTVYAILDAGVLCHVGYTVEQQAYVPPTLYWRHENRVYWHGSSASRMVRVNAGGTPVCVTVTHLDGIVLARSGFNHSANYRSVMAFGMAHVLETPSEKFAALKTFTERLLPGRWADIREPTDQELKGTTILWLDLDEVSAKVRTGPPVDDEADYMRPVWAGVLPLAITAGTPQPDPRLVSGVTIPPSLANWTFPGSSKAD